jgi:hypothetical protein
MEEIKVKFEKIKIGQDSISEKRKLHPAWRIRKIEAGTEGMEFGGFETWFDEELANTMPEYDHLRPKFDNDTK